MHRALFLPISALALFAACGGNVVVDQPAGTGGAVGAGGSVGTGDAGSTGFVCTDAGPQSFPAADKVCAGDSECTIETVYDCCAAYPLGVASAQVAAYQAYETTCNHYGPCPCPSNGGVTITEDGKQSMGSPVVNVACQAGACSTYTE